MEQSVKKTGISIKIIQGAIAALIVAVMLAPVWAAPPPKKKTPPPAPSGADLYNVVWRRVRPNPKAHPTTNTSSAVAGIRGEEKSKFLKPYWKGEKKTETPDAAAYREAGKLIDQNQFEKAVQALLNFVTQFPKSPLVPKVKVALAVCYAQLGKKDDAANVLTEWLKEYPNHEMAAEVKTMLADLKK